jgi:hypothetical protein
MKAGFALAGAALLGGCAAGGAERAAPPARMPVAVARPLHVPVAGHDPVIGRTAAMLSSTFGPAALDIREGTARKLQFESAACVLDAYLYPPAAGGEAIVTHVDTRMPDGRDIDRASCVAALTAARARH